MNIKSSVIVSVVYFLALMFVYGSMSYIFVGEHGNQALFFVHQLIGLSPSVAAYVLLSLYVLVAALLTSLTCAKFLTVTSWGPSLLSGAIAWALVFLTHSVVFRNIPSFRDFVAFFVFYAPMMIIPLVGVFALVLRHQRNRVLHRTGEG